MRVEIIYEAIDRASRVVENIRKANAAMQADAGAGQLKNLATVEKLAKAQADLQQQQSQAFGKVATAGAGLAATVAPIMKAVSAWSAYEDVLTDIALKTNMTKAEQLALSESVRAQSASVNMSSIDMLKGIDQLAAGGLSIKVAAETFPLLARAALATKSDMNDLSKTTVSLVNNLKLLPAEVEKAFDVMAQSGKDGQFELKDMAAYFPKLGASYAAMGQTGVKAVADLTAGLQVMRKNTGSAEQAVANLDDLLLKITSENVVKNFDGFGIDIQSEMAKAREAGTIFETLHTVIGKATGGDLSKLNQLFGDKQSLAGAQALMQHYEEFITLRQRAMAANGVVDSDFAARMQIDAEKINALSVAVQELFVNMGQAFAPAAGEFIVQVTAMVQSLSAFIKANPELASGIAMAALAFTGLNVAMAIARLGSVVLIRNFLSVVSLFMKFNAAGKNVAIFARLGRGIGMLAPLLRLLASPLMIAARGFMMLGAAIMATPVGWIIAAIAVIAMGAIYIWRNWDTLGPKFQALWNRILAGIGQLGIKLVTKLREAWSNVKAWFASLRWPTLPELATFAGNLLAPVLRKLQEGWQNISTWFASINWPTLPELAVMIGDVLAPVLRKLQEGWQNITNWFASINWPTLPELAVMIVDVLRPVLAGLQKGWQDIKAWFASIKWPALPPFPDVLGVIKAALGPVLSFVSDFGALLGDAIGSAFDKVSEKLSNFAASYNQWNTDINNKVSSFIWGEAVPETVKAPAVSTVQVEAALEKVEAAKAAIASLTPTARQAAAQATSAIGGVPGAAQAASNSAKAMMAAIPVAATQAVAAARNILAQADFTSHGVAMMNTLAAGIRQGSDAAVNAVAGTVGKMRAYLPHSPAKVGPLSDLDRVQFSQTFATAITAGAPEALRATRLLALGLRASVGAGLAFAAPQVALAQQAPKFAKPGAMGARSVSGGNAINVNLTFSPQLGSSTGGDVDQIKKLLPQLGHELARAIQVELDRRERTKH
jgi:TP901 family phage tail tape measure protein